MYLKCYSYAKLNLVFVSYRELRLSRKTNMKKKTIESESEPKSLCNHRQKPLRLKSLNLSLNPDLRSFVIMVPGLD